MFSYFKKHLKESILAPLFKFIEATLELLVPFVVKQIINVYLVDGDMNNIVLHIIVLVMLGVVGYIFCIIAQYEAAKAATLISADIRNDLMENINDLSKEEYESYGKEKLISIVTTDINQLQTTVNILLRLFLRSPFVVIGGIVLSLITYPSLGIYSLIGIPIAFVVLMFFISKSIKKNKIVSIKLDETLRTVKDDVTGIRFIKANNDSLIDELKANSLEVENSKLEEGLFSGLLNPISYIFINVIIAIIVVAGTKKNVDAGSITACYNYMMQILWELVKFANLMALLSKGIVSYKRIKPLLYKQKREISLYKDKISIKNMSYKNKIKDINLEITDGEIIGLIGPLSSGKSTLIDLINDSIKPTSGFLETISNISTIRSETKLFNKSIKENITLGRKTSEEEIKLSIENSCLDNVVSEKGIDFVVGENGILLSGGERQRVSIARALLNKPDLVIFDEAFSSLDNKTSSTIKANIKKLGITSIICSERYIDMDICSRIVVLNNGSIESIGTHDELMNNSKTYHDLVLSQMKEGETNE